MLASGWSRNIVQQAFVRAERRDGPIRLSTKFYQGLGIIPEALKDFAFRTFVLLYYNQVLGLPATYVSLALGLALLVDAVSDPLVGSFSDNFRHRWGRRHPLMLAAVVPFALCIYALFAPPAAIQQGGALSLGVWLVVFTVSTRVCMTFYTIPWSAMFAELSEDYLERSRLMAWRFACGWVVGIGFTFLVFSYVFAGTEAIPQGQLNGANYARFALVLACTIAVCGIVSTLLTLDQVRFLPQPQAAHRRFSPRAFADEVRAAVKNRDFIVLWLAALTSGAVSGTSQALQVYVNTYFWGMDGDALRWITLALIGGFLGFLTVAPLQARIDKKHLLVLCALAIIFITAVPVTLRLLGLAPPNGTGLLVALVVCSSIGVAYFATIGLIMFASMVADTLDVQEYRTGLRQEGLFNSAMSFAGKASTAGGVLLTGLLIDFVIGMPERATAAQVTDAMVLRIGVLDAYVVPAFNIVWLWLALKYGITREQHAAIRAKLAGLEQKS